MRRTLAFVLVVLIAGCGQKQTDPNFHSVAPDDPEMQAAITEARSTLPTFLTELKTPKGRVFSVKFPMATSKGTKEHIWVGNPAYASGTFTGQLDNDPVDIPGKKAGDTVSFHEGELSDWLIMSEDGTMTGGYTVKILQGRGG